MVGFDKRVRFGIGSSVLGFEGDWAETILHNGISLELNLD